MKNDKLLNNLYMHVRWHLLTSSKCQLRDHGIDDVLVSNPNEISSQFSYFLFCWYLCCIDMLVLNHAWLVACPT